MWKPSLIWLNIYKIWTRFATNANGCKHLELIWQVWILQNSPAYNSLITKNTAWKFTKNTKSQPKQKNYIGAFSLWPIHWEGHCSLNVVYCVQIGSQKLATLPFGSLWDDFGMTFGQRLNFQGISLFDLLQINSICISFMYLKYM